MAEKHVYVISDLHLGGSPALPVGTAKVSFQMCPPESRRRLARFIEYVGSAKERVHTQLVINGDFVDFLAEEALDPPPSGEPAQFEPFTADPAIAVAKLERIMRRMDEGAVAGERIFTQLQRYVAAGHELTILLGNHDLELSIPHVRYALLRHLTGGRPARVEFIYDGEAYDRDGILIEHGNRYDGWNAVLYGALRAFRSTVSRGEDAYRFRAPPGSELVCRMMNAIKQRYAFVDLLKPENEAVIPLLLALEPGLLGDVERIARGLSLYTRQWKLSIEPGLVPEEESQVAAGAPESVSVDSAIDLGDPTVEARTRAILDEAVTHWGRAVVDEDESAVAAGVVDTARSARSLYRIFAAGKLDEDRLDAVRRAWVTRAREINATFDLAKELPEYLEAARRLAAGGKVVAFGHTHLAKKIAFASGGLYLNTGTWCSTIRMPAALYDVTLARAAALPQVRDFVGKLCNGTAETRLSTTYAHIVARGDRPEGKLFEFRDGAAPRELAPADGP